MKRDVGTEVSISDSLMFITADYKNCIYVLCENNKYKDNSTFN